MRVRCWHTAAVINNHSSRDLISSFLPICRIIAVAVCPGQTDAFVYSLERSFKLTSLGEGNRDTAVPAEGNGDLQTLICVLLCETQTMSHIVESCPLTKLNGGLSRLHSADEETVSWLTSYGI